MNSTDVLQKLRRLSLKEDDREDVNIVALAAELDVSVSALVSMLTELEHRDEIIMNISPLYVPGEDHTVYTGTVKLMRTPPDELPGV